MFQGPENGKAYACGQSAGVSRAAHLQRDAAIVVVIQHENGAEVAHVDRPVLQRLQLPNFCRQNTIQRDSDRKCATKNARKHGADSKPIREPARWSPRAHTHGRVLHLRATENRGPSDIIAQIQKHSAAARPPTAVSYTHLTLPTICSV